MSLLRLPFLVGNYLPAGLSFAAVLCIGHLEAPFSIECRQYYCAQARVWPTASRSRCARLIRHRMTDSRHHATGFNTDMKRTVTLPSITGPEGAAATATRSRE